VPETISFETDKKSWRFELSVGSLAWLPVWCCDRCSL